MTNFEPAEELAVHSARVLAGFGILIIVVAILVIRAVLRRRSKPSPVDAAPQHIAKGRDLRALSLRGANVTAERVGVKLHSTFSPRRRS